MQRNPRAVIETTIKTRSKRCALCPINFPTTAMHPLYDTYGRDGRPILAKKEFKDEGILWVHSLCAFGINANRGAGGCIYGCDAYGKNYNSDEESEEDSDDDKPVKQVYRLDFELKGRDGSTLLGAYPNHFVFNYEDDLIKQRIKDFQSLKCQICKRDDKRLGSKQIPIQVMFS